MIALNDRLADETIVPGQRDQYKILALIGRGGMGAVYRAQRLSDGTVWALKEMRSQPDAPATEVEENRRLFMQEARLLASLSYPNLPVVAELFEHQGRPTMIMEFVPGQTLEDRMREANAPLPMAGHAQQLLRLMAARGLGEDDPAALVRLYRPTA